MLREIVQKKFIASYEKSASEVNGIDPTNLVKNNTSDLKTISFPANSVAQPLPPPQKKRAFQMSAHEVFIFHQLDLVHLMMNGL